MSHPSHLHPLQVVHAEAFTADIMQLLMRPEHPLRYNAGDYIMLGFSSEALKPFSIAAAPREDGLIEVHIKRQEDSAWMQQLLATQAGDTLVMQGPKSQMALMPAHQPILFIAGGTGFAPMKALLEESLRQEVAVPIHFYWGARYPEELYLHDYMLDVEHKHGHIHYIPVISEQTNNWQGATGLVHQVALQQHPNLHPYHVYMCGPWPMIQTAKSDFIEAGLSENHLVF